MAEKFVTDNVIKVVVVIPLNTKVINIVSKNSTTDSSTPLIEFQYLQDIDTYLNMYDLVDTDMDNKDDEEALFNKTATTLKRMSPGGQVVDVRIKLNSKQNVDPIVVSLWEDQKNRILKLEKILIHNASNQSEKLVDNIDMSVLKIGGHKVRAKEFDGAMIEYYIRQPKGIELGDKLSNRFGAKGVTTHIITKDKTPRGEFSGEVEIFVQPTGLLGRKNTSMLKELYVGKLIHYLPKIVSNKLKAGIKLEEVKKLILEVYDILDPTKDRDMLKSITEKLASVNDKILIESLINEVIRFNYIIPPFNSPTFDNIKHCAKLLNIPLNERVYIPETDTWTKTEVPVGYAYYSALEQLSSDYESTRSTGGYVSATSQPTVNLLAAL